MNSDVIFVTGNEKKAEYMTRYLGFPIKHLKFSLEEIQSLDLKTIVEHKVRQAWEKIHEPIVITL